MANDRHWFLTWHTYGTWLPGRKEGFVSPVIADDGSSTVHNIPGTTPQADLPNLELWALSKLKGKPIQLTRVQAREVAEQLLETARYRGWTLLALAIVTNHAHVVVGVVGDPDPTKLLNDFKSYATRRLDRITGSRPESGAWWTESGSKRKLSDENSILGAIRYTIDQAGALVIWTATVPELKLNEGYLRC